MKKKILWILMIVLLLFSICFQDVLIQAYVSTCNAKLERYAWQLLEKQENTSDSYGSWKTKCYPEAGMVEFWTGGWGLVPSSTYKGFYYSADDTHKVFSVANGDTVSIKIHGDYATWTDGTDNHGTSRRIAEKWFWFEASF